ncbi:MAG: ABC transporter substrate-binding protein [Hyphomicrobiales bacterium]|nr:ABC transporter substrate-binding protein [Hyphomicrobiales bacterium]
MNRKLTGFLTGSLGVAALMVASVPVYAQGTVKIGMINVLSGQFADAGIQMDNGAKTYMKQFGDTVAGKKIEIIRRDVGGAAPDVAKRLAQELVVRDNVDLLAGFLLTPNALAAADVSAQAKKFMVVMNAATSIIITKSPYMIRTSVTLPQVMETFGAWAYKKGGLKKCYTMVTDYGPGHDSEAAFVRAFKEAGGEIVGSVRFPVANPDFSAFVQRAKDLNPECIYIFIPGGSQPAALGKAFAERGVDLTKTKVLASGEATAEQALKAMGDAGIGILSAWHYDYKSNDPRNVEFVKIFNEMHGRNPDFFSIGGYDGMHGIYEAIKKAGGKTDGDALIAAAKGMTWDSPRGPMSIDAETRDVVQTIYVRKVEKVGGELVNVPFDKIENVKDPSRARGG